MLRLFKTNHVSALIFLFGYALLLKLILFIQAPAPAEPEATAPLSQLVFWLMDKLSGGFHWPYSLLSFLLIYYQAIILNRIVSEYKLTPKRNYLPAMAYVLVTSVFNEFSELSPALIASTFLLHALALLFEVYNKESCSSEVFNIGCLLSVASLFYLPALFFVFLFYIGMIVQRPFNWREWVIGTIGFIVPYFLTITWMFWQNELLHFVISHFYGGIVQVSHTIAWDHALWVKGGMLLLLAMIAFRLIQATFFKHVVQIRKNITLFIWAAFLALLSFSIGRVVGLYHFALAGIPFAFMIGYYFSESKRSTLPEVLHLLLVLAIFYYQYSIFIA